VELACVKRAGYVLAGGRSSRMGRDKARLPFRGVSLVEAVAREVEKAAGAAVVVASRERVPSFLTIPDLYPGEGPLGGILTALIHSKADWNLVVACDMPEISAGFLAHLMDEADGSGAAALLPAGPSGMPEPLCAVYHCTCRGALERAFGQGIRKITDALAEVATVRLSVPEAIYFQNVNTPDEWSGYAAK
jgi:molybdopterin-guanine dinucleotide biosynthesis protein A